MLVRACSWTPGIDGIFSCAAGSVVSVASCPPRHAPRCRSRARARTRLPQSLSGARKPPALPDQARYLIGAPSVAGNGSLKKMALLGQSSMQAEQWMHSSGYRT